MPMLLCLSTDHCPTMIGTSETSYFEITFELKPLQKSVSTSTRNSPENFAENSDFSTSIWHVHGWSPVDNSGTFGYMFWKCVQSSTMCVWQARITCLLKTSFAPIDSVMCSIKIITWLSLYIIITTQIWE